MSYITNEDIERRLGSPAYVQLTDDDGNGSANEDVVDEVRLGAEGEVNSYLARRYAVPIDLTAHPELAGTLATIALDIAEYRLRVRRPPAPAEAIALYEHALHWLNQAADGKAELPSAGAVSPNPAHGPVAKITGDARILTREELSGH